MTPRKAKDLLGRYFGQEAVNAFDPLWPETMLGTAPGAPRDAVLIALRHRLALIERHPDNVDDDALLMGRVLRSVAAQMIDGPGAEWSEELEAELHHQPHGHAHAAPIRIKHADHIPSEAGKLFRKQARALVAVNGTTPQTIAQLYALADADGLPPSDVEDFLAELITPVQGDEEDRQHRAQTAQAHTHTGSDYTYKPGPDPAAQRLLLAIGAIITLAIVAAAIAAIVIITGKQANPSGAGNTPDSPASAKPGTGTSTPNAAPQTPETPPTRVRPSPPTADGPPDGRVFARSLNDALNANVPAPQRERTILSGIDTLRRWWPRIDPGSRIAAVQAILNGAIDLSQSDATRESLISALKKMPVESATPAAIWHEAASVGLASVLIRERELPAPVIQTCKDILSAATGSAVRRNNSTFEEGAVDALVAMPQRLLTKPDQPSAVTRAQADGWLTALRAAVAAGSADDAAKRSDTAILNTVERLLTSAPNASESRAVFDFAGALLIQVRFREGDPGRERVLSWFADTRFTVSDIHLITSAVATRSAAAGIEATMVLSPAATQAQRDDLRAKYAEAWARPTVAAPSPSGGSNSDWFDAARSILAESNQATGDLEQLTAAAKLAAVNQAASLRSRGLPAAVSPPPINTGSSTIKISYNTSGNGDGEWARRFLTESRTSAARLGRITEFEQLASPGPVDCEVLAEAALTGTGETRAAAQRAALKRTEEAAMVNAVLEALPKVRRNANAGDFLGQFTLAGTLPVTSERWSIHFRKALIERLLTLLSAANATVAADRVSASLAEEWATIAGSAVTQVQETEGPTESVLAAAHAYNVLITQIRQQVPAPTALIHPDMLDRAHAGRLLVANGLPQAFAANQVSAVEALAVLIAAERPAATDQCRALIAAMTQERAAARSIAVQIRITEATALRLWAIRLGEPL